MLKNSTAPQKIYHGISVTGSPVFFSTSVKVSIGEGVVAVVFVTGGGVCLIQKVGNRR